MARVKTSGNGSTRKKQVAATPAVNPAETQKTSPPTDLELEIRRRAYSLVSTNTSKALRLNRPRGDSRLRLSSRAKLDRVLAAMARRTSGLPDSLG